jgi:transcription factor-like protein
MSVFTNLLQGDYTNNAFIFGHSVDQGMRNLHPCPMQAMALWEAYQENVAPMVIFLHRPTIRQVVMDAIANPNFLDQSTEALLFSVYLAAVISMTPEQCYFLLLGEDRRTVIRQYRFAMEQALARADFLNSRSHWNLTLLQAVVLFLTSVGSDSEGNTRFVWSMISLVLRIAQGLRLHRDISYVGLRPFEAEMRRRLWCQICYLDFWSSQDHDNAMIPSLSFDTQFPRNVNDDDFRPDSIELPEPIGSCEDMMFGLFASGEQEGAPRGLQ